ncbi:hypothetical protein [Shouchella lehensis]|uniref:Uncharacterized protein n=1 Tax=Shouchella lehensis TaxID=300825 RepID=A0A4Y7WJ25_9BACI|nr:hypothetical protein [Shouchella lehensis]MBG9785635.1 hypothetical protein [Shouchella lehensis]TES48091.1 hypothetical protein E2L03_13230 [Shouchella lehensis]
MIFKKKKKPIENFIELRRIAKTSDNLFKSGLQKILDKGTQIGTKEIKEFAYVVRYLGYKNTSSLIKELPSTSIDSLLDLLPSLKEKYKSFISHYLAFITLVIAITAPILPFQELQMEIAGLFFVFFLTMTYVGLSTDSKHKTIRIQLILLEKLLETETKKRLKN